MNGLPYYKAYPRDFFEGTVAMPFDLKSAYRLILDLIYMHGGSLPDEPRFIAGNLGCSVRAWSGYRAKLIGMGKISADLGIISNLRANKELDNLGMFQDKQRENASKPRKRNRLASAMAEPKPSHTEPEPDTVKREAKASPQKQRASRLSPDWFLPKEWGEWAVSEGCSVDLIRSEADKFRDYWTAKAGASAAKLDWQATWRNWIRAAIERAPSYKQNGKRNDGFDNHGSAQGRGNGVDPALANILRLARVGQTSGDDCGGTGSACEEIRPFRLGS